MAYTLTSQLATNVSIQQVPTSGFLSGVVLPIPLTLAVTYLNGTAADKIDLCGVKSFTFSGTTPQTVDLKAMLDVQGAAVNCVRVRAFIFRAESTTDAVTVTLSPNASNGWSTGFIGASSSVVVQAGSATNPNGAWLMVTAPNTTGMAVDATHKVIDFTPSATCTATLIVLGCSA